MTTSLTKHKWEFASKFKRNGFSWKSDLPIQRIKEALSEIKAQVKKEPVLAAEGAIVLLEKLSPALTNVDSSSGAIGGWVNKAIDTLVPIIASAKVDVDVRQKWLERLWQALEDDEMPYIESLGDEWGALCVTPELSSLWADRLLSDMAFFLSSTPKGYVAGYYKGTSACYSALFTAKRFDEIFALNSKEKHPFWSQRVWAVKALAEQGKQREAIDYALASDQRNQPTAAIARVCESILLDMGLADEAYEKYAFSATQSTTNVATYKALVKKYPTINAEKILKDLVGQEPFHAGKWFATAKDAGYYGYAIWLANQSPADIKTLGRAVRDFNDSMPVFAFEAGMAALHWISLKQFYELNQSDIDEIFQLTVKACHKVNLSGEQLSNRMQRLVEKERCGSSLLRMLVTSLLLNLNLIEE